MDFGLRPQSTSAGIMSSVLAVVGAWLLPFPAFSLFRYG
jgi:hypothetical protein